MSNGIIWAVVCALIWTAGMIYFDWRKGKKK